MNRRLTLHGSLLSIAAITLSACAMRDSYDYLTVNDNINRGHKYSLNELRSILGQERPPDWYNEAITPGRINSWAIDGRYLYVFFDEMGLSESSQLVDSAIGRHSP